MTTGTVKLSESEAWLDLSDTYDNDSVAEMLTEAERFGAFEDYDVRVEVYDARYLEHDPANGDLTYVITWASHERS